MKNLKLVALLPLFAMAFFIVSCGDGHSHDENGGHSEDTEQTDGNATQSDADVDKTSKEYASAYICPMHCKGSGSDAAGTCPACGMDYVANEDYQSNGEAAEEGDDDDADHDNDEDGHEGHNH